MIDPKVVRDSFRRRREVTHCAHCDVALDSFPNRSISHKIGCPKGYDCTILGRTGRCGECHACKRDGIDELVNLIEDIVAEKANTPKDLNKMTDEEVREMFGNMDDFFDEDEPVKNTIENQSNASSILGRIREQKKVADERPSPSDILDSLRRRQGMPPISDYEAQGRASMDEAEALKVLAGIGQVSPSRGLHRGDGPDVGVKVRGTREVCVGNTFTLWGHRLSPGDALDDTQRAQLRMIASNPITDNAIRKVVNTILDAAPTETFAALAPIEEPAIPQELADEMTMRAREALIATGEFPGMEEQVRAGYMDNLSGIRSSIQAMRDMGLPVPALQNRVPAVKVLQGIVIPRRPSLWSKFGDWMESFQHRFVRLWSRYEAVKARNLELAAQIVNERQQWQAQIDSRTRLMSDHVENVRQLKIALGKANLNAKENDSHLRSQVANMERKLVELRARNNDLAGSNTGDTFVVEQKTHSVVLKNKKVRQCTSANKTKRWVASDGSSFSSKAEAEAYVKTAWLPTGGSGVVDKSPTFIGNDCGASSTIGESSLAAFLNKASPEDRAALLELAKIALVSKANDPCTKESVLTMRLSDYNVNIDEKSGRPKRPPPPGPSKVRR